VRMGIPGFEPSFLIGIDAVQAVHGSRLAALAGRRLSGFAVVRFAEDGEWFADCPVVLDFDGIQVEVCHWKLDELSIGWDTIDTTAAIAGWEWADFTPVWSHADQWLESFTARADAARRHDLDENRIETGAAQPDYVRHRLTR
jgi:hypothetical protein